jgi:hypothetical protein
MIILKKTAICISLLSILIASYTIIPTHKQMEKITIHTPNEDSLVVSIIPKDIIPLYLNRKVSLFKEIYTFIRTVPIYKLDDSTFLMCKSKGHALLINNEEDFCKIYNEDFPSWFSLLKERGKNNFKWYYSFDVSSNFIKNKLALPYQVIIKKEKNTTKPPISIRLEDGKIINYIERTPGLYQGTWFNDEESFLYYWKNNFT